MSFAFSIQKKEWIEFHTGGRFRWVATILYLLFVVALASGISFYNKSAGKIEDAQTATYRQWLNQGRKNPHGAAHFGFYAFKPLSPMSVIDKGLESYLGQAVWLEAHNQNEVREREATDAGSIVRFGQLSIGFIVQVLFPLCILLLGYNLYSKEREGGTLSMLLTSGATAGKLLLGKVIALYRLILLLFLPMLLITNLSMMMVAGVAAWKASLLPFCLFTAFSMLYFAIWVLLSLYLSSRVRQSSLALVSLLSFWIVGVFLVPRMGSVLAKLIHPTPSSFLFSHNIRMDNELGLDRKTPAALRQKRFEDSVLRAYQAKSIELLPISMRGLNLQRSEEYGYQIFEKNYGALAETYQKQDAVMNWLHLLSPVQSMRSLTMGVSGTDLNKQNHFAEQAEAHRRLIAAAMNDDITKNSVGVENYGNDEELWRKIPPFQYKEASVLLVLRQQAAPLLSLVLWITGLILLLRSVARAGRL